MIPVWSDNIYEPCDLWWSHFYSRRLEPEYLRSVMQCCRTMWLTPNKNPNTKAQVRVPGWHHFALTGTHWCQEIHTRPCDDTGKGHWGWSRVSPGLFAPTLSPLLILISTLPLINRNHDYNSSSTWGGWGREVLPRESSSSVVILRTSNKRLKTLQYTER